MIRWGVDLTSEQRDELAALINSGEVSAAAGTRARIMLWHAQDRPKKDIAAVAGGIQPTVDLPDHRKHPSRCERLLGGVRAGYVMLAA